jgi:hypothetical protein
MRINIKRLRDEGLKVDINDDDTIDIYGQSTDGKILMHLDRISERLHLSGRDRDDLVESLHRISIMSAVRRSSE